MKRTEILRRGGLYVVRVEKTDEEPDFTTPLVYEIINPTGYYTFLTPEEAGTVTRALIEDGATTRDAFSAVVDVIEKVSQLLRERLEKAHP